MLDYIIIGGGVAGLTFGYLLKSFRPQAKFVIVERGDPLERRVCPHIVHGICNCSQCNILHGIGGGGFFSDGKIVEGSGWYIEGYTKDTINAASSFLVDKILGLYPNYILYNPWMNSQLEQVIDRISSAGFDVSIRKTYWYGTEEIRKFTKILMEKLKRYIFYDTVVKVKHAPSGDSYDVVLRMGGKLNAKNVIIATGRYFDWPSLFVDTDIVIRYMEVSPHVGVRVEVEGNPFESLSSVFYDIKLYKYGVRSFCFNPYGVVIQERHPNGNVSVNGFSYRYYKTRWTNFAVIGPEIPYTPTKIPRFVSLNKIDERFKEVRKVSLKGVLNDNTLLQKLPDNIISFLMDMFDLADVPRKEVGGVIYYPEIKLAVKKPQIERFNVLNEKIYFIGESTGRIVGIWASMISSILLANELMI